jgi:hypothetical protein
LVDATCLSRAATSIKAELPSCPSHARHQAMPTKSMPKEKCAVETAHS